MKLRINIRPAIAADLTRACEWYEREQAGLGAELMESFYFAVDEISDTGSSLPANRKGFRHMLLDRFPYVVYFRVVDEAATVLLVRHTARDPSKLDDLLAERDQSNP